MTGRTRGRPRSHTSPTGRGTREDLLAAAADIFCTQGYDGASTHAIAKAAAVSQASLYHYFSSKAEILAELLDVTVRQGLTTATALRGLEASAPAKLWALTFMDASLLCNHPVNIGALYLLPQTSGVEQAEFWDNWKQLRSAYTELVTEVSADRQPGADPSVNTDLVLGLVESVVLARRRTGTTSPVGMPEHISDAALRLLGLTGQDLEQACAEGRALSERLA